MGKCRSCDKEIKDDWGICKECVEKKANSCPFCDAEGAYPDNATCKKCGENLLFDEDLSFDEISKIESLEKEPLEFFLVDSRGFPEDRDGEKYDPQWNDRAKRKLIKKSSRAATLFMHKTLPSLSGRMGMCHSIWGITQNILYEKYNIKWHTPSECNPDIKYD